MPGLTELKAIECSKALKQLDVVFACIVTLLMVAEAIALVFYDSKQLWFFLGVMALISASVMLTTYGRRQFYAHLAGAWSATFTAAISVGLLINALVMFGDAAYLG